MRWVTNRKRPRLERREKSDWSRSEKTAARSRRESEQKWDKLTQMRDKFDAKMSHGYTI